LSSKLCRAVFHRSRLLCAVLILSDELSVVYIGPVLQTKAKSRLVTGAIAFIWVAVPAFQISVACLSTDLTLPYRTSPYPLSHLASPNLPHFRRVEAIMLSSQTSSCPITSFYLTYLTLSSKVSRPSFSLKRLALTYLTLLYLTLRILAYLLWGLRLSDSLNRPYVTLPYLTLHDITLSYLT